MQTKQELICKLFLNQCSLEELEHLLQLIKEDQLEAGPEIMMELFRQLGAMPDLEVSVSNRIFKMVEKGIDDTQATPDSKKIAMPAHQKRLYWRLGSAAAVVVLLLCSIWALQYFQANTEVLQQTAYGETKELLLPDSSLVVLNGNSSINYTGNWQKGESRVVRLNGEAYFKVRKKPATQAKFQVITTDLTVEVLGTAFNVNTHRNETRVFLEEGNVKINLDHQFDKVVNLAPGEAMQYSTTHQKLKLPEKIVQEEHPNWRAGFLPFKEMPLQLILEELSQAHKLEFFIADTILAKTRFTITLPTENMDETMGVIGKTVGGSILKEDTRYIIDAESNKKE